MKLALPLIAVPILMLSGQRASAPVPVALGVALKCIALGVIVPTAVIIYKCDQSHYLCRYEMDGEVPWWAAAKANPTTLRKTGGRRCEGPWPSPDEPAFRAWVNNRDPYFPVFPCGPLGTIPSANTNAPAFIQLQQSSNGGASWTSIASTTSNPNDNLSFVVFLTNSGTNGMSSDQLRQVADCDVSVTNATMSAKGLFRLAGREASQVDRRLETAPAP